MDTPENPSPAPSTQASTAAASKTVGLIAFDDRYFVSHCLPFVQAAVAVGLRPVVITRVRNDRGPIEAAGARVVALEADHTTTNPMKAGYAAGQLSGILKALQAEIVHAVGLRAILVAGTAAAMAGIPNRVYSLTGLGRFASRHDALGAVSRTGMKAVLRGALSTDRTRYLFEESAQARALGLDPLDTAVLIVGGIPEEQRAQMIGGVYAELLAP